MNSWITTNKYRINKVLSGRSNVYLVSKNNRNILIDTGKASAYEKLKRNIEKIKLKDSIDFLILTHAHYSHCQNAQKIKEQFGCKIIISYKEKTSVEMAIHKFPKERHLFLSWFRNCAGELANNGLVTQFLYLMYMFVPGWICLIMALI